MSEENVRVDCWTPERVHKAFQAALQQPSVYSAMLPFFESVYMLQEASVASARPEPMRVDAQAAPPRLKSSQLTVDWPNALHLLGSLCQQAHQANPELETAARVIAPRLAEPGTTFKHALFPLIEDRPEAFASAAGELGVKGDILAFFLFNSVWPSIARHARKIAAGLNPDPDQGACPICGAPPFLSLLDDEGRRGLVCSFCRHQWHAKRIFCPFCGESDNRALSYFFAEEEKAYRVHTCQSCLKYIKNVDTRELKRLCYPPLEAVLTAHLDLSAQQLGFKSVTPVWLAL